MCSKLSIAFILPWDFDFVIKVLRLEGIQPRRIFLKQLGVRKGCLAKFLADSHPGLGKLLRLHPNKLGSISSKLADDTLVDELVKLRSEGAIVLRSTIQTVNIIEREACNMYKNTR